MKPSESAPLSSLTRSALLLAGVLACAALAGAGEIPRALHDIVLEDEERPVVPFQVNGLRCEALLCFSDVPYLLWPADAAAAPALSAADPEPARRWLSGAARELGFAGFEPRFLEKFRWLDNDVFTYELVRGGLVLHDARVMVHWNGGRFAGVQNHVEGRLVAIEEPAAPAAAGVERVYYPVRADGGVRAVLATVTREQLWDRTRLTIRAGGRDLEVVEQPTTSGRLLDGTFKEYVVPQGNFPDQISVAPDGIVWFSQPNHNFITSFDPVSEQFAMHPTTGGSGPDGMIVGTAQRVWSGMYYSGSLGLYDIAADKFFNYPAPYASAKMAIPVETTDGHVWVTDHEVNRISEFNPATSTWIQSISMPTPSCWVVQGHEDTDHGQVYFTEYNANKLGRIAVGGNTVTDIVTPGGGPAFCVYSRGTVYYSRWNESGLGAYNVETGAIKEYEFPVANEWGGPLWLRPNGDIVAGTRNRGYVMIFDIRTTSFASYQIPTSNAGLKDGMTVGPNNVIWFTETGANKLAKLQFSVIKGDLNCDGITDFGDINPFVLAISDPVGYAATFPGCDISAGDINGDGVLDFGDINPFIDLLSGT